jgi:hypothetical protein
MKLKNKINQKMIKTKKIAIKKIRIKSGINIKWNKRMRDWK